jgi:hypothetical protein
MMFVNGPLVDQKTQFRQAQSMKALKQDCTAALDNFDTLTLSELRGAKLMKRTDTKYIFPESQLLDILADLQEDYAILEVDQVRMQDYQTLYFDTPDFRFYQQHHNGQRDRFKLRVRSYLDSDLNYIEVKRKDNHNRTQKSRLLTDSHANGDSPEIQSFLESALPFSNQANLVPKITNRFNRIALVSKRDQERMSLDLDLRFMSPSGQFSLPGIVIAEVKQPHFSVHSVFIQKMRQEGYRPTRFSKYCIGIALAYPDIKRNAFKPLLLDLQKLVLGVAS